jgi:hypothetical protein
MKRLITSIVAASIVLLATTGCVKLDMELNVSANDTVSGSATIAFSKELVEYAKNNGGDTSALESEGMFESQPGVTVEEYSDEKFMGTTYRFVSVPLDKFAAANDSTSLKITRDGDNLVVSGELDSSGGNDDLTSAQTNPFTKAFFDGSSVTVAVTLPGEIKSTNGVQTGNKIVWEVPIGEKVTFEAVSYSPKGIDPVVIYLIVGALAVIVIAGVLVVFLKRRRALAGESTN